jgi:hypothetical protein
MIWAARLRTNWTALYFVQSQDMPVLLLGCAAFLLVAVWRPHWPLPRHLPRPWVLLLVGAAITSLLACGTYCMMGNYPLSRDEHMVLFDMAIFDRGRMAMPLAPQWQPYASALVPEFLLNSNHPIGLVSAYLPMNALVRLAFSKLGAAAWLNPLWLFVGGIALLDIARRTFGVSDPATIVVLLVYALSAQALVTAMTTYSMTGHLALNLIWLAAFLRGGKFATAVAIIVGFVAVGFHQLVFHPFFVAPFLLWKLREGQWKLVSFYAGAYGAIILWWACYPILVSSQVALLPGHSSNDNFLTERLLPLLLSRDPRTVPLMVLNLMRFFAWENLALVPLLAAGIPVALRERGLARALLLGILAWIVLVTLILPSQGRGWGYRYLHPYIGSCALLAGFGYRELERRIGNQADGMVILLSSLTLLAAIPLLLLTTYQFMLPHVAMQRLIDNQRTPFVLIDDYSEPVSDRWSDTATDDVRNRPDLANRPLRFSAEHLTPDLLAGLCRQGSVTLVSRSDMHRVGFLLNESERSPSFEALLRATKRSTPACFRSALILNSQSAA